jgi:hypothetical protein
MLDLSDEKRATLMVELQNALQSNRPKNCKKIFEEWNKYHLSQEDKKLLQETEECVKEYRFLDALNVLNTKKG